VRSAAWELAGRTAFITGAAQGIGFETGRRLAARGMNIALVDLDEDQSRRAAGQLGAGRAIGLAADVTDRSALEAAVAATVERFGGIDVSIPNAGVSGQLTTVLGSDPAVAERTIEIDLLGVYRTVRATLPHVVERRGYVLSVASLYAYFHPVLAAPYAMSKAGVEQLGRALRAELAPHGASAGVAYFGFIDTQMVRDVFTPDSAAVTIRSALPGWLGKVVPVGRAADAMARGVERRAPRVTAPRWLPAASALRGLLALLDDQMMRNEQIRGAVARAESSPEGPRPAAKVAEARGQELVTD
jgi:NAD(P)-dependent dehydrogenase (short-subunit alcohol dehydrogenase family)